MRVLEPDWGVRNGSTEPDRRVHINGARHSSGRLIKVEKGYAGKRPRTWVEATRAGRAALKAELAALHELIGRVDAKVRPARWEEQPR